MGQLTHSLSPSKASKELFGGKLMPIHAGEDASQVEQAQLQVTHPMSKNKSDRWESLWAKNFVL